MCDNCIKLCTYKVNGLGNDRKEERCIRTENASIYFLQETHLNAKAENMVRAMWGYDCILSGNDTNSNDVAVLFKNNLDFRLHAVIKDDKGKYIILDTEMLGKRRRKNIHGDALNHLFKGGSIIFFFLKS